MRASPTRMTRFERLLPLLALAILLGACDITKHLDRKNARAFSRQGMVAHLFNAPDGIHFTWASASIATDAKPKLLLVHGITSSNAMWAVNLAALSKSFDLIVPDLIGHGRSTNRWEGNSVDAQVAHLVLVLDSLQVREPVFVVGNSYGGAIAANLAEQHPERVKALVIYDGPASDYTSAIADSVARSAGAEDITALFTPHDADEQYRLLSMAMFEPPKVPRFVLKQMHKRMAEQRLQHLALLQDLLRNEALYAAKEYQWTMPVHVIWGEGDRLIPPSTGTGIARRNHLPADHLIMIPGAGHVANMEQKGLFEQHLIRILQEPPCMDDARKSEGACTMDLAPFCGCDGRTYRNRCAAWRAGVRLVKRGSCE